MDYTFWTGIVGSVIIVLGAAWPTKKIKHPVYSTKNWLFAVGAIFMLVYAIFGYLAGGPIFFIFIQILVIVASVLMMIDLDDTIDTIIISICGVVLIIWSAYLVKGYGTILFVVGLAGLGLGYAFQMGTVRRSIALLFGSGLIAGFSYMEQNWIFFWLNIFFALFSAFYLVKKLCSKYKKLPC